MSIKLLKKIQKEESIFFILGWLSLAFFSMLGNTTLGLLLLIIHTIYIAIKKKRIPYLNDSRIYILMSVFISWSFITTVFAYDKQLAFLAALGYCLILYIIFFGAQKLLKHRDFLQKYVLPLIILSTIISSLYTIIYYYVTNKRAVSLFVGFNGIGTLLIFGTILLIAYFERWENKNRYLLIIPIALSTMALLLTLSRGALLGLFAGLLFYSLRKKKNFIIFIIIISLLLTVIFSVPMLRNRFLSIFSLEANKVRIDQYISSIEMIKDHPITGIGPNNFSIVYPDYRVPNAVENNHPYSHNIFLNITIETGVPGIILYLLIILLIIKMGWSISKTNSINRSFAASFIGIIVHQQFDCTILGLEIGGIFWLIAGLITALYIENTSKRQN